MPNMGNCKIVALLCLIATKLDLNECSISDVQYKYTPAMNDKMCTSGYHLFSEITRTTLECLVCCTKHSNCLSIFFNPVTSSCDGCMLHVDNVNLLVYETGTISYTKVMLCGPLPSIPHVTYGEYVYTASEGYTVTYTCYPCTYFLPTGTNGEVTCQASGTWTTPICVNAADTGFLQNGNPVPVGATGCVSYWGYVCPNSGGFGSTGFNYMSLSTSMTTCFCDNFCCGKSDCCYDYGCY